MTYTVRTLEPGNGRTRTLLTEATPERAHQVAREYVGLSADAVGTVERGATFYRGPDMEGPRYMEPGALAWVEGDAS